MNDLLKTAFEAHGGAPFSAEYTFAGPAGWSGSRTG